MFLVRRAARPQVSLKCKTLPAVAPKAPHIRSFLTLGIETSCDDTSVAVLKGKVYPDSTRTEEVSLVYHKTITSSNRIYGGVHPIVSLESHQHNLAPLIKDALKTIGTKPDLIAVTRGPGMGAALSVGLDTANGLAASMDIPIVGVHHMQAHALTPRLDYGLNNKTNDIRPSFPFLTLLVSGGHTILLESTGLTEHKLLAASQNIAVGDCLDKAARELLPKEQWGGDGGHVAYGKILEDFAFPNGEADWGFYYPPGTVERDARTEKLGGSLYDFRLSAPLTQKDRHLKLMAFSFTGLGTSVERMVRREGIDDSLKQAVARELFVAAFEHLAKRIHMAMEQMGERAKKGIPLVVSGGVASNRFLRHLLRVYFDSKGYNKVELLFPPPAFCTDNAAMIAWAGLEMYGAGWETELGSFPLRKWSLDPEAQDGGILGVGRWRRRDAETKAM